MGKKKESSIKTAKRTPDKGNEPKVVGSDKAIEEKDPMDDIQEISDLHSPDKESGCSCRWHRRFGRWVGILRKVFYRYASG